MKSDCKKDLKEFKYKYYSFNRTYNKGRLTGKIYLASPLEFNDPFDCQLEVLNNTLELQKDDDWFKDKLISLGFEKNDISSIVNGLKQNDIKIVELVRKRQLEKTGIVCLTSDVTNITMWAYYAQHTGFCIEYDTNTIICKIVLGFINKLSTEVTKHLYEDKQYSKDPIERAREKGKYESYKDNIADSKIRFTCTDQITNSFLIDQIANNKDSKVLNFVQNVFIKRFGCRIMDYVKELEDSMIKPTLFHNGNKDDESIKSKYYKKHEVWENEKEYRLFVSLGGKMELDLGTDIINHVIIGCETTTQQLFEIISILNKANMKNTPIKQMIRGKSGLELSDLSHSDLHNLYEQFNSQLKQK